MAKKMIGLILFFGFLLIMLSSCDLFLSLNENESSSSSSSGSSTGSLIFWSKLDSSSDVTSPTVGLSGSISGGSFVAGKYGNAYKAGYGENYLANFPKEVIPGSKGCIEFWGKLEGANNTDSLGLAVRLVKIEVGMENDFGIQFAANDGAGGSGICGEVGGKEADYATGPWPTAYTYGNILGDATAWHHYALVWDIATVGSTGKQCLVYLDGSLASSAWYRSAVNIEAPTNGTLGLVKSEINTISVLIDNLKIYNYAKTDFSDRLSE